MSGDECTICEGGGGWWQLEPDADTWRLVECEHCDRTGIDPHRGADRLREYSPALGAAAPGLYDWVRSLPPIEWQP